MGKRMSEIIRSYEGNVLVELFDKANYQAGDHLVIRSATSGLVFDSDRVMQVINIVTTDAELDAAKAGTRTTVDIRTNTCWRVSGGVWSSATVVSNPPYVWGSLVQSPLTNKTYRVNNDLSVTLVCAF